MVGLGVLSQHQDEFHLAQVAQKLFAPSRRALEPWRKIAGAARTGKAKAHGHQGELLRIVEYFPRHAQPLAQTVSAGVVEGHTGLMDFSPRCLSGYQHPRFRTNLHYGPGAEGQMCRTDGAGPDFR